MKKTKLFAITLAGAAAIATAAAFAACELEHKKFEQDRTPHVYAENFTVTDTTVDYKQLDNNYVEYSLNGESWQTETLFTGLTPNTQYTYYFRYGEIEDTYAGPSVAHNFTTLKSDQTAPADFTLRQADKTVTVSSGEGAEYSYDGGATYTDANTHTFTQNGDYAVKVRYKETQSKNASEAQSFSVRISDYYGGFGTEESPYLISTVDNFNALANAGRGVYKLINDLDFTDETFTPAGRLYIGMTFDGDGHKLTGVKMQEEVSTANDRRYGIFKQVDCVKNLIVENAVIDLTIAKDTYIHCNMGIIAAETYSVENCKVSGTFTVKGEGGIADLYAGGIAGKISENTAAGDYKISDCYADVKFNIGCNTVSTAYIGGIVGENATPTSQTSPKISITKCGADIVAELFNAYSARVGGIAGDLYADMENCYAKGDITVSCIEYSSTRAAYCAGLSGGLTGTMKNCYASVNVGVGGVNQNIIAGGLIGYAAGIKAENCFVCGNVSANLTSGNNKSIDAFACVYVSEALNCYLSAGLTTAVGAVTAATEAEIKSAAWQTDVLKLDASVWSITDGEYPVLK